MREEEGERKRKYGSLAGDGIVDGEDEGAAELLGANALGRGVVPEILDELVALSIGAGREGGEVDLGGR